MGNADGVTIKRNKTKKLSTERKCEGVSTKDDNVNSERKIIDLEEELSRLEADFTLRSQTLHKNIEEVKRIKSCSNIEI